MASCTGESKMVAGPCHWASSDDLPTDSTRSCRSTRDTRLRTHETRFASRFASGVREELSPRASADCIGRDRRLDQFAFSSGRPCNAAGDDGFTGLIAPLWGAAAAMRVGLGSPAKRV